MILSAMSESTLKQFSLRSFFLYLLINFSCFLKCVYFLSPMCMCVLQVCNATHDRKHANVELENYVTVTVMNIITTYFSSPFSDQSTNIQVVLTYTYR